MWLTCAVPAPALAIELPLAAMSWPIVSVLPERTLSSKSPPSAIGALTAWLPCNTLIAALPEKLKALVPPIVYGWPELKLMVRNETGESTVIVRGPVVTALKFTNALGSFGATPLDQRVFTDQLSLASSSQEIPVGGVTCAQVVSTRSSSTVTSGTPVPCRKTNPATDGPPLKRSVPAIGAER